MDSQEIALQHNDADLQDKPRGASNVHVEVDSREVFVHRGSYTVAEFKVTVGVSADRELDQIIENQLTPLDDSAEVVIKGGEKFISHVRAGGSS